MTNTYAQEYPTKSVRFVVASAAEAELGALFHN
jgi:hypothetical protein